MVFHSVKGGVGKSTLATLTALGLAQTRPGTAVVLIDMDLTGTSLADVLPLDAPAWDGAGPDLAEAVLRAPDGFLGVARTQEQQRVRLDEDRACPWGVPFLNDFLLLPPPADPDVEEADPAAFLWRLDGGPDNLRVVPSSALPADVERIVPFAYDEERSSFLQGRLEFLLDALIGRYQEEGRYEAMAVVIDTPPTIPGLSRAVLSLGLRLGGSELLPLTEEELVPGHIIEAESVRWTAALVATSDLQDHRALLRWLEIDTEARGYVRPVVRIVLNRVPGEADELLGAMDEGQIEFRQKTGRPSSPLAAYVPGWLDEGARRPGVIEETLSLRIFESSRPWSTSPGDDVWSKVLAAVGAGEATT